MEDRKPECHPICKLAHQLMNSLSVIVASCDLVDDPHRPHDDRSRYVSRIRDTAKAMAATLSDHQCNVAVLARRSEVQGEASKDRPS